MKIVVFLIGIINIAFASTKPVVTTTLPPYAYAIKAIASDAVDIHILIPDDVNPHLYELKPADMKKLSASKLWFCSGEGIEKKIQTGITAKRIDLNKNVHLIHNHSHDHHGHDCCHHSTDLHTWTSPENYLKQSLVIKDALVEAYPEHKETFEKNFLMLEKELLSLKNLVASHKVQSEQKPFLVTHAAYAYLCRDLNLKQISLEHDGKEASLKHIQKIQMDFKNISGCKIFAEVQHSDQGAKRLSDLIKAKIVYVNPYQKDYPQIIHQVLENIE